MPAYNFTVLVELKRPDTPIFGSARARAGTWRLTNELIEAVSQILEQKAGWQIKSEVQEPFDDAGNRIVQKTLDPKCILIFGRDDNLDGTDKGLELKLRTFELFRRDSRNIEIVTFNELFERAAFIVRHGSGEDDKKER